MEFRRWNSQLQQLKSSFYRCGKYRHSICRRKSLGIVVIAPVDSIHFVVGIFSLIHPQLQQLKSSFYRCGKYRYSIRRRRKFLGIVVIAPVDSIQFVIGIFSSIQQ
uniref:Uncharacterized protein n=1 Tax=Pseudo-nitzschia australis TaxID=44445 RepID=A0A6U9ZZ86_9STRA